MDLSEGCLGTAFSPYFSVTQKREECVVIFPDDTDMRALVNTERPQPIKQEELCDLEGENNGNGTKFSCAKCKVWHGRLKGQSFSGKIKHLRRLGWSQDCLEMAAQHSHKER